MGKNGEVLFDRPKPTAGCSANGRRRKILAQKFFLRFLYTNKLLIWKIKRLQITAS